MAAIDDARNSYWDSRFKRTAVKLLPGEYFATNGKEMLVTVLGSCVSACIRDAKLGIGGMNHFLLPNKKLVNKQELEQKKDLSRLWADAYNQAETRYGDLAMELLINDIIRRGGKRENLEAKIFGGAQMFDSCMDIGQRNIDFVRQYLDIESIKILSHDLAGNQGRKIYYIPETGDIFLKRIIRLHNKTIEKREASYLRKARMSKTEADIDFF